MTIDRLITQGGAFDAGIGAAVNQTSLEVDENSFGCGPGSSVTDIVPLDDQILDDVGPICRACT